MAIDTIGAVAGAVEKIAEAVVEVQGEKNTPEMVKAVEAAREQEAVDKTNEAIGKGDLEEVRKEVSG
jgi:hypothetical protein